MYVVLDTRTGKYLRHFSGSLNSRWTHLYHKIAATMPGVSTYPRNPVIGDKVDEALYSASRAEAKIYSTPGSVAHSFYSKRWDNVARAYRTMEEALPHLKIVPVTIT